MSTTLLHMSFNLNRIKFAQQLPMDDAMTLCDRGKSIDIGCYESSSTAVKDVLWNDPGLRVFPNPVMRSLNFELDTEWIGEFNLVLYDHLGRQVHQAVMDKSGKKQTFQQNIAQLTPGQYVLLAVTRDVTHAAQVVIAR